MGILEYERHRKGRAAENQGMVNSFVRENRTIEPMPKNHEGHDSVEIDRMSRTKWGGDFDKTLGGIQGRQYWANKVTEKIKKKMPKKEKELYCEKTSPSIFLR